MSQQQSKSIVVTPTDPSFAMLTVEAEKWTVDDYGNLHLLAGGKTVATFAATRWQAVRVTPAT